MWQVNHLPEYRPGYICIALYLAITFAPSRMPSTFVSKAHLTSRIAKAEKGTEGAREAHKVLRKESALEPAAVELDLAEAEVNNVCLEKEFETLRSRVDEESAVAKVGPVDSENQGSITHINGVHPESVESDERLLVSPGGL
jgi:hypothetical protein